MIEKLNDMENAKAIVKTIFYNCDLSRGVCVYKLDKSMNLGISGERMKTIIHGEQKETLYGVC